MVKEGMKRSLLFILWTGNVKQANTTAIIPQVSKRFFFFLRHGLAIAQASLELVVLLPLAS
jgi:hypothetical protein